MTNAEIIIEKVSMKELLNKYVIFEQRKKYLCPFHNDKHPSAGIDRNGWFHCFACGINYNVIEFVKNYEKCDFKTAIVKIDNMFGLGLEIKLTDKQIIELENMKRKREKENYHKKIMKKFEKNVQKEILFELKFWEYIQKICHPTKGEIKFNKWQNENLFFYSLKRQEWLNWLYDIICEFNHKECEFDYEFEIDKTKMLRKLYKGEISI